MSTSFLINPCSLFSLDFPHLYSLLIHVSIYRPISGARLEEKTKSKKLPNSYSLLPNQTHRTFKFVKKLLEYPLLLRPIYPLSLCNLLGSLYKVLRCNSLPLQRKTRFLESPLISLLKKIQDSGA